MNHLIKPTSLLVGLIFAVFVTGCGDSQAEKAAKERERQRIEQEKQAQIEAEKANKAITANNQKMFSRMNASSPGATESGTTTQVKPQSTTDKK
jgi:hypothetical protein